MTGVYSAVTLMATVLIGTLASPQAHPDFSVRREGRSGTTTDMYLTGLIGGLVGGGGYFDQQREVVSADPPQAVWHGDTLTLLPRRGPRTGDWSERRESWSLDADGRLRVEVVTEAHDRAQQGTVLHYRRE